MKTSLTVCVVVLFLFAGVSTPACLSSGQAPAARANSGQRPSPSPAPPKPAEDRPFLMAVEDVFAIAGRGTVVTGRVERGRLKVGDAVEIVGRLPTRQTVVTGIEAFRKLLEEAKPGETVGLLLRGVERRDVTRGQVIAAPGSIKPHVKLRVSFDLLKTEDGGRRAPITEGYRPQFLFHTSEVTGTLRLAAGGAAAAPGARGVEAEVELSEPVAAEEGMRFSIREGGRVVGSGVVLKPVE